MTDKRLNGKRVLITQAEDYMGPDTIELFREHGAEIIADSSDRRETHGGSLRLWIGPFRPGGLR